jgi:hypothetical protein
MKALFKKRWFRISFGVALGGIAGFSYWYFVGCQSGTCPLTSSPTITTVYGAVVGLVAFN